MLSRLICGEVGPNCIVSIHGNRGNGGIGIYDFVRSDGRPSPIDKVMIALGRCHNMRLGSMVIGIGTFAGYGH